MVSCIRNQGPYVRTQQKFFENWHGSPSKIAICQLHEEKPVTFILRYYTKLPFSSLAWCSSEDLIGNNRTCLFPSTTRAVENFILSYTFGTILIVFILVLKFNGNQRGQIQFVTSAISVNLSNAFKLEVHSQVPNLSASYVSLQLNVLVLSDFTLSLDIGWCSCVECDKANSIVSRLRGHSLINM